MRKTSRSFDHASDLAKGIDAAFGEYTLRPGPAREAGIIVIGDDVAGDITTDKVVTVGGDTVVSSLETIGDQDFYRVELEAGKTYEFDLFGAFGGPNLLPLADSYLELYDAAGNLIVAADGGASTTINTVNSGFDAILTYTAPQSGTYYVNARAFDNVAEDGTDGDLIGDYELTARDVTNEPRYIPYYSPESPLYSIDWGSQVRGTVRNPDGAESGYITGNPQGTPDNKGFDTGHFGASTAGKNVITIYFAKAGDIFISEDPTQPSLPPATVAVGAKDFEISAIWTALHEFEKVADVIYVETQDRAAADFEYFTYTGTPGPGVSLLGSMSPPGELDEGLALFNSGDERWNAMNLAQGGFSFVTLIHEFGHGHGLAHPHDNGGHSGIMNGVEADGVIANYTLGDYQLNQAVFTMMSYQDGWPTSPYGNAETDVGYGYLGGLMAFDIAAIQDKYGVNEEHAIGSDVYVLKDENAAGTYYASIWDAGGSDSIVYAGTRDAVIDLRPASLEYDVGGGGFVSYAFGIYGGFTIANGVVIERAVGGGGDDLLIGNAANNVLIGGDGDDILDGGMGNDTLAGRAGDDTASYALAAAGVTVRLGAGGVQDTIGAGRDKLVAIENLFGSAFDDRLTGSGRANQLDGGAGDDSLDGGAGRDVIAGGAGVDRLRGGADADVFAFADGDSDATMATADVILDFTRADTIDLTGIDADGALEGDQAFAFIGSAAFSGVAGELRVTVRGDRFFVTGDTDGDGAADFMIVGHGEVPLDADFRL